MMRNLLLLNGPNLNLLGQRQPEVYGTQTLASIEKLVCSRAEAAGWTCTCLQSNHEGVLIDAIQQAEGTCDGIVYNPGAHAHYSYALRDAIASITVPVVEVHLSDIRAREPFRALSVIEPVCAAQICGRGVQGYLDAFDLLNERISGCTASLSKEEL